MTEIAPVCRELAAAFRALFKDVADQNVYAYSSATGNRGFLDADNVYFTGTWAASTQYVPYNAAQYGVSTYVANGSNLGMVPLGAPLVSWSPLVLVHAADNPSPQVVNTYGSAVPYSGTITFDLAGNPFQGATATGSTFVTVVNQQAPGAYAQSVNARIASDGSGTHALAWDKFLWLGSNPPSALPNWKSLFVTFTSTGTLVSQVYGFPMPQV